MHVTSVGVNGDGRELDGEALARSLVVVESRTAALAPFPAGSNDLGWAIRDGAITADHIHAELGELVAGTRPGRTAPRRSRSTSRSGVAAQDAAGGGARARRRPGGGPRHRRRDVARRRPNTTKRGWGMSPRWVE